MSEQTKAVMIDSTDGKVYERTWGGLAFRVEKNQDGSIKVKVHDQDTEIVTARDGEYGAFWVANIYGGKGLISFKDSKFSEGDYCLIKLNENVRLPRNPTKEAPAKQGFQKKTGYQQANKKPYQKKSWASK